MALPYILTNDQGNVRLVLNQTFLIAEHDSAFGWGIAATPRTHGDRAMENAYLNGKSIELRGFVSAGRAGGSLPFGWSLTTQVNSTLAELGGSLTAADTTITLASATGFAPSGGRIQIESEIIYYGAVSGNNLVNCVRGAEGTTVPASHLNGVTVIAPSEQYQYYDQLREIFAHLCTYQRGILDYRNGWLQYVLFEGLKVGQAEGWPDVRTMALSLKCEDPLAYNIPLLTGVRGLGGSNILGISVQGNAPTTNYKMTLRATGVVERTVVISHLQGGTAMTLRLPSSGGAPLVISGWRREMTQLVAGVPEKAWSRFQAGSVLPTLLPPSVSAGGINSFTFAFVDGTAVSMSAIDAPGGTLEVELTAHSADYHADSFRVPQALPPGTYDLSTYDVNVYG